MKNKLKGAIKKVTEVKQAISTSYKEGLPKEAFAIVGDPDDPATWKLPHHTKAVVNRRPRYYHKRIDLEKTTVDWDRMPAAVAALSPGGYRGERVQAPAEDIIKAARHLANHYQAADKPVPDTLGALI